MRAKSVSELRYVSSRVLFCLFLFCFTEDITITATDARWVGAWWLGILICGSLNLLAGIPFWFLPKSLRKEGETNEPEGTSNESVVSLQENDKSEAKQTVYEIAKGKLYCILVP